MTSSSRDVTSTGDYLFKEDQETHKNKDSGCVHCPCKISKTYKGLAIVDKKITRHLRSANIKTRPVESNGIWSCAVLPIVLGACNWSHNVSPVYKLVTFQSYGLFFYSILFSIFLYVSSLILKESFIAGFTVSSLLACIPIYYYLGIGLINTFLFASIAVYPYLVLLKNVLVSCPNTFTIGEAMIVSQAIVLFLDMTVANFYYGEYNLQTSSDPELTFIKTTVITVLSTVGLLVTALYALKQKNKKCTVFHIICGGVAAIMFALMILHYNLGVSFIYDFVVYLVNTKAKRNLMMFWLILVALTVLMVALQTSTGGKSSSSTRKTLHILASLVFLSGILADKNFLTLAAGIVFAIVIFIEAVRVLDIDPISSYLQSAFEVYSDEKDCGVFAMTPIYLYAGLACPLLLVPRGGGQLELLSGVLAVGVGDSAASAVGERLGTNRWPDSQKTVEGTIANVLSQVIVVYILECFGYLNAGYAMFRTLVAASVSAVAEAHLDQVDNLVLPLVTILAFQLTAFLAE